MRVILAALVLLTIPTADWELLGTRRVSFTLDHDAIIVGPREGGFTAIKIEVVSGNLEMYNVKVTFGNGQTFSPETRIQFHEGSWSRTIDLPGPVRILRRVDFWYRSRLRRGVPPLPTNGGVGHESRRLCVRGPLPRDPQHLAAPHLWRDRVCDRRWFRHRGARHETLGGENPGEQRLLLAQLLRS